MADIQGTNVAAPIVPFTTDDAFATHVSEYGQGGWQEKQTLEERNAITLKRRKLGMAVYVLDEQKLYILKHGITNEDWEEYSNNGGITLEDVKNEIEIHNTSNTAHKDLFEKNKSTWLQI